VQFWILDFGFWIRVAAAGERFGNRGVQCSQCPTCHSEHSEESRPGLWRKESEQDSSLRSEWQRAETTAGPSRPLSLRLPHDSLTIRDLQPRFWTAPPTSDRLLPTAYCLLLTVRLRGWEARQGRARQAVQWWTWCLWVGFPPPGLSPFVR